VLQIASPIPERQRQRAIYPASYGKPQSAAMNGESSNLMLKFRRWQALRGLL
jgi:hypothetical protein